MASPYLQAGNPTKAAEPTLSAALWKACADRLWLRGLLVLAVTILLSVLPFKAPSIDTSGLVMRLTGADLAQAESISKDRDDLVAAPLSLKVAKRTSRKFWPSNLDAPAAAPMPLDRVARRLPRRPGVLASLTSRSPPQLRLRDPPLRA
jgi:hypothetical protein